MFWEEICQEERKIFKSREEAHYESLVEEFKNPETSKERLEEIYEFFGWDLDISRELIIKYKLQEQWKKN